MQELASTTLAKEELDYGKIKESFKIDPANLEREIHFTKVYKKHFNKPPYVLELACLRAQFPAMFAPIAESMWFAGEYNKMLVGVDPERGDLVEAGYFCKFGALEEELNKPDISEQHRRDIQYLLNFWRQHSTYTKCRAAFPPEVTRALPDDDYYSGRQIAYPMFGLGGPYLNYDKLARIGINGLRQEVEYALSKIDQSDTKRVGFYKLLLGTLALFTENCLWYAKEAETKAALATDAADIKRLLTIAASLKHIAGKAPESYHQALQLVWLFNLHSLTKNYGRLDVVLGDFLAADLDTGRINYDEALEMTVSFWKAIVKRGDNFNNRIVIGGKGRRNPKNADRWAKLALEVQGIVRDTIPQLSLRWYKGMDERLYHLAFETLSKGSTFPIIYNDDANVTGVKSAFYVPYDKAEQYIMYGCGEYIINHQSIGSPDAAINIAKALDVSLHNGWDSFYKEERGLKLGSLEDYATFEDLQKVFAKQVEYYIENLAKATEIIYRVTGEDCAFPFLSLLYDDCIPRGKGILQGGVKILGGEVESFGNNTAADSLLGIKKAVYEQKIFTPRQLLKMLKSNYEGYDKERQTLLNFPKFGNDNEEADAMSVWVNTLVAETCRKQTQKTSLDNFLMVMINNGDSVMFGKYTGATADGRKAGVPLSNGNQPGSGYDKNGLTALLNSMTKLNPGVHAGVVHNVKLSRSLFNEKRPVVEALFKGYFDNGGTQVMITITDRKELEDALAHPEKYTNLIVRVGGYSERFIDLPRDVQMEIINRTLY